MIRFSTSVAYCTGRPILFRSDYLPPPGDRLSRVHDNRQQQRRRQYVETLAAAAAVAADSISNDACRSPSSREEAPYVREHAHSRTAEARTAQRFLAAADRPRSSSRGSTQQRRQSGSGGGQLRANEPPIVRLMTPCLGGCALFGSITCGLCAR